MPALRELQAAMAAALDGRTGAAERLLHDGGLPAGERLAVYRNNSWSAFRSTLELAFPAVRRLGGDDWFRGAARAYRAAHPSRAGDLQQVGGAFASFLREHLAGTDFEVIADVAALEWAYQEVLVAGEAPVFDVALLGTIAAEDYGALRFALAPATRLVASTYPVLDVWLANRDADAGPDGGYVDLAAGPQHVLLLRRDLEVELHRLAPATHAWLECLAGGATLAAACERAFARDPDFPLAATLQRHVALGALRGVRLVH